MPLTPVALTDTFDVWRVRTNQVITLSEDANGIAVFANTVARNAYDKANSANYLAFLTNANTVASFNRANSANYFAFLTNANTVAAFDKANAANVLAYTTSLATTAAFTRANSANAIAIASFNYANGAVLKTGSTMTGDLIVGNIAIYANGYLKIANGILDLL